LATHDRGDAGGVVASGIRVVGKTCSHEQRSEVGVSQAERTIVVRVLGDHLGGVSRVIDQDLLRGDHDIYSMAIGFDVEGAVGSKLQQVQTGQVAGRVVEKHVFGARIGSVDPSSVLRGVPAVDRGVELHAGISALPGGFGDLAEKIFGFVSIDDTA